MIRPPPRSPLSPHPTLFRPRPIGVRRGRPGHEPNNRLDHIVDIGEVAPHPAVIEQLDRPTRSEEHTSELQSQSNIVCRLLLEKKKTTIHLSLRPALEALVDR